MTIYQALWASGEAVTATINNLSKVDCAKAAKSLFFLRWKLQLVEMAVLSFRKSSRQKVSIVSHVMRLPTVHRHLSKSSSLRSSSNHDDFNSLAIIEREAKTTTPEIALLLVLLKLHRQDASFYDMFSHFFFLSVRNQLKCFCACGGPVYVMTTEDYFAKCPS